MNEIKAQTNPAEAAFSRLQEFPSDYIEEAQHIISEQHIEEMGKWANAMGTHIERQADRHRAIGQDILATANRHGSIDPKHETVMLSTVRTHRTGFSVESNGDISATDHYPFYGDTPAQGWTTYRAPKNIKTTR